MTRDEAKTLAIGTLVRWQDDRSATARFARIVSTEGYKFAEVERRGYLGLPSVRLRKRYEEIEVFPPARSEEKTEKRLARRGR
jgi:hypothetical protein